MKRMKGRGRIAVLAVAAATLLAACGGSSGGTTGGGASGSISISGSSTVEPISSAVAQKFSSFNPDVSLRVDGPGTGDGFALFCDGNIDVADASRPIKAEEVEICEENGVEFVELKVAIDGIAVLTSPENDAVDCLTFADLYALLGPESEGFDSWADASELAQELGGTNDFPDVPLVVTAPGEESGTYDSFVELVLEEIAVDERGQPEDGPFVRPDYQASPNDNVIIEGITGNPTSLGWVGYAFYVNNQETVKALEVDNGETGCVGPTQEAIQSAEYPISRFLYIYVNAEKAEQNDALQAYIDFYLSDDGIVSAEEVGYVGLHDDDLQATRQAWEDREIGTRDGGE
jgi:phosphate transport system substrate-binding protein